MRKIIRPEKKAYFISSSSIGGYEEKNGPLGDFFDLIDKDDKFGQKSFEMAEAEMARLALSVAIKKAGIGYDDIDILFSGDLENQCVASSWGLYPFGIPYVGLYGACSTCAESLLLSAMAISEGSADCTATVTTSHNSAAERQFRTPIEYGGQKTPSAQWTATAGGAFILSKNKSKAYIAEAMVGKIVDGLTKDASNMGAAMARAAYDTIYTYLSLSENSIESIDAIFTGDLGKVGSDILRDLLKKDFSKACEIHFDCGMLLYDSNKKNIKAGASGCGCSASVLASYILPKVENGELNNILFLSTGALMNPSSVLQGESILGIAPILNIRNTQKFIRRN